MENRSGETNNTQNSAENAFDYAAADITNELPRGDMLQDPAGEPFQSTFEEEKPKKLNFFNKIGRMNPQKRAVLLVRIFIVIAFSVLFAVYCVKNRANFEIDSLAVSAVSLAVFTAVLIAAVPQIIKVFSGDDAQLAPSGIEKANGKTFLKIVLAAFVLRAALTIFGMIVFYCLNPKFQGQFAQPLANCMDKSQHGRPALLQHSRKLVCFNRRRPLAYRVFSDASAAYARAQPVDSQQLCFRANNQHARLLLGGRRSVSHASSSAR